MYVFMDESGDAGFRIADGSTNYFCVALVRFETKAAMLKTEEAIRQVRAQLGFPAYREFHFSDDSRQTRIAFLRGVVDCDFRIRAIVVDKSRIFSPRLRKSPRAFYQFIAGLLLKHHFGSIQAAKLYIDGRMDRELKTHIQREMNRETRQVESIKFKNSATTDLIQLADMVAGALARSYKMEKADRMVYYHLIQGHCEDIWEFDRHTRPSDGIPVLY